MDSSLSNVSQFVAYLTISVLLPGGLLLAIAFRPQQHGMRWCERQIGRLARHQGWAVFSVGLLAFFLSIAISELIHMPQPHVEDEFSYLLAADTFAHGRLTNPAHPLWQHFESIFIIQQPSYASKYPPGQGLILAAGQALTGNPLVGVWLSVGLACAALCWMLMGWVPQRWAFLGGLMAALHPMMIHWGQCYWGGAVAVIGGALVTGALRRITERPQARHAFLMGLGVLILTNSRPYEGSAVVLLSLLALAFWLIRERPIPAGAALARVILPLSVMMMMAIAWIGYDDARVTGSPLRMPYMNYEETYEISPFFLWQPLRTLPPSRHADIRDVCVVTTRGEYLQQHTFSGFRQRLLQKMTLLFGAAFPSVSALAFLFLPSAIRRDGWLRWALGICGALLLALSVETWLWPHYAAPAAAPLAALMVHSLRHLRAWRWRGRAVGRSLFYAALIGYGSCSVTACVDAAHTPYYPWIGEKQTLAARLGSQGGRHLVFVHYGLGHSADQEWIYNAADMDHAPVIWARELTPAENQRLRDYYPYRKVWWVDADARRPVLLPSPSEAGTALPPNPWLCPHARTGRTTTPVGAKGSR